MLLDSLAFCPEIAKKFSKIDFMVERVRWLASSSKRRTLSAKRRCETLVVPSLTLKEAMLSKNKPYEFS